MNNNNSAVQRITTEVNETNRRNANAWLGGLYLIEQLVGLVGRRAGQRGLGGVARRAYLALIHARPRAHVHLRTRLGQFLLHVASPSVPIRTDLVFSVMNQYSAINPIDSSDSIWLANGYKYSGFLLNLTFTAYPPPFKKSILKCMNFTLIVHFHGKKHKAEPFTSIPSGTTEYNPPAVFSFHITNKLLFGREPIRYYGRRSTSRRVDSPIVIHSVRF